MSARRAVVIGSSGGIGAALVQHLEARPEVTKIYALSRAAKPSASSKIIPLPMDILDESQVQSAAAAIAAEGRPDLVILATGVLSTDTTRPEKSYTQQTLEGFQRVFELNTFGPGLVAKHFLPLLPRQGRTVFAALSARVGSISDNRLGGWHAYRASKAALNMLLRTYAIEQTRKNPDSLVVGLHPGTVDTALSAPFQSGVPPHKLFTPQQSAAYLVDVIDRLTPEQTGAVYDWQGSEIPA